MLRSLAALAALLIAVAAFAPVAVAQTPDPSQGANPFQPPLAPVTPEPTPTPEPVNPNPTADDGGDLGSTGLLAVGGGLLALFAVIGFYITRDARRSLPRRRREPVTGLREEGPHRKAREAKSKARAKARAARAARKRNRVAR